MKPRDIVQTVVRAFKSEFAKEEKERNPWPLCRDCYHRQPWYAFCNHFTHGIDTCTACCPFAGSHPEEKEEQ